MRNRFEWIFVKRIVWQYFRINILQAPVDWAQCKYKKFILKVTFVEEGVLVRRLTPKAQLLPQYRCCERIRTFPPAPALAWAWSRLVLLCFSTSLTFFSLYINITFVCLIVVCRVLLFLFQHNLLLQYVSTFIDN